MLKTQEDLNVANHKDSKSVITEHQEKWITAQDKTRNAYSNRKVDRSELVDSVDKTKQNLCSILCNDNKEDKEVEGVIIL